MKLRLKVLLELIRDSRGAEIAEAAAVLPLMFMILIGIFWFGQAFSIYGAITRAAQEGARAGAASVCTTCTAGSATPATNAVNAVTASLAISNLNSGLARLPSPVPSFPASACGAGTGGPGGPTCDSSSVNVCVQEPVLISNTSAGTSVCGISVSFQYPFQFSLPFTSLNNQKIWMTASARVRLETQ
jgi:Flp pilus assembly protein TadG